MAGYSDDYRAPIAGIDAIFGTVEIAGKVCGVRGCDREPVAATPIRTREKPEESGVRWFCREHAEKAKKVEPSLPISEIVRTCGVGEDSPCGAAATYVAIVGIRGMGLQLLGVCDRHYRDPGPLSRIPSAT